MPAFSGQLNANEIFAALYNMIISQEVRADNIAGTFSSLVDKARVDGSLYGDTKLFYSPDVLKSRAWLGDNEASSLLAINRPAAPECQAIVLDQFRQIDITVDNYLTKRAWMDEGAFSSFNSVMLGMAATFAPKEQRAIFKMLKNIDLIECNNDDYAPQLTQQALKIAKQAGTKHLGTQDDGLARNEVYALQKGDTIVELIILSYGHNGSVALTAMSGEIPVDSIEEISKIKPQ